MVDFNIVVLLPQEWRNFHRPSSLKALAAHCGVLVQEKPIDYLFGPLIRKPSVKVWHRGSYFAPLSESMFLLKPRVLLPWLSLAQKVPNGVSLNRSILRKQCDIVLTRLGWNEVPLVLWLHLPWHIQLTGLYHETLVVFECYDNYSASTDIRSERQKVRLREMEDACLRKADLVITTSHQLFESKKDSNPHTHCLPNAVDYEYFSQVADPEIEISDKVSFIKHPVIGYLGTIHEETDVTLVDHVARNHPTWSFVFIGQSQFTDIRLKKYFVEFVSLPNVHFLGWLEPNDVIKVCKAFDVCIIPYKSDSDFNRFVWPNKLHEYMAMGKPIVSTDIPEVRHYSKMVKIAQNGQQFEEHIEWFLIHNNERLLLEQQKIAQEHTWEKRAKRVTALIRQAIARKGL